MNLTERDKVFVEQVWPGLRWTFDLGSGVIRGSLAEDLCWLRVSPDGEAIEMAFDGTLGLEPIRGILPVAVAIRGYVLVTAKLQEMMAKVSTGQELGNTLRAIWHGDWQLDDVGGHPEWFLGGDGRSFELRVRQDKPEGTGMVLVYDEVTQDEVWVRRGNIYESLVEAEAHIKRRLADLRHLLPFDKRD